jgi:hypothetical protein
MIHPIANPLILGTFFEYFDFVLFASFSIIILPKLLPWSFHGHWLVLASFWSRPLFAFSWDRCARRWSHEQLLRQNILLMSGATLCIALLPFESWPQTSIIALFCLRLAQVAAFSNQFPTALYLLCHTQKQWIHWLYVATALGAVFANLTVFLMELGLPWQLPFIISGLMLLRCTKIPKSAPCQNEHPSFIHHLYLLPFALGVILFQLMPSINHSQPIAMSMSLLLSALLYLLIKSVFDQKSSWVLIACFISMISAAVSTQNSFWILMTLQIYLCFCFEVLLIPYTQKISKKYLTTSYQLSFLSCGLLLTALF